MGLSQSFSPKRGGKTRPWTGFHFNVQTTPVPKCSGASLAKRESRIETHDSGKKSASSSVSTSSAGARKKGSNGVSAPDVSQFIASFSLSSLVLQFGMLSHSLEQWRSITSNRFVLNMVQGHHLQLRSCLVDQCEGSCCSSSHYSDSERSG